MLSQSIHSRNKKRITLLCVDYPSLNLLFSFLLLRQTVKLSYLPVFPGSTSIGANPSVFFEQINKFIPFFSFLIRKRNTVLCRLFENEIVACNCVFSILFLCNSRGEIRLLVRWNNTVLCFVSLRRIKKEFNSLCELYF